MSPPKRTVFASFAQSIAVFTMSVSALPSHVWLSNPPSPICCVACRETLFIPLVRQESFLLQAQGCLFRDVSSELTSLKHQFLYQINVKLGSAIGHQVATHVNPGLGLAESASHAPLIVVSAVFVSLTC